MANKDLVISIPYRKYVAIREALERGGNDFDEQLQRKAEEWYQTLIPQAQREMIEQQIQGDMKAEELRMKSFAVVCIKDDFESYAFTTENGEDFYSIAKDFAELEKDKDLDKYTLDTLGHSGFRWKTSLDESVYEVLCDAIKVNPLISVIIEFDLCDKKAWVLEQGAEDWKEFDFERLTNAVQNAEKLLAGPYEEQTFSFSLFLENEDFECDEGQGLTQ